MGDEQGDAPSGLTFARLFDTLSSEYGWTDDQILDLTLRRIRLAAEAIAARKQEEDEFALLVAERIAQGIVGGMVGLAMSKKAGKSIVAYAKHLRFFERDHDEEPELPSTQMVERLMGGRRR